jgi:hypothetical protein
VVNSYLADMHDRFHWDFDRRDPRRLDRVPKCPKFTLYTNVMTLKIDVSVCWVEELMTEGESV